MLTFRGRNFENFDFWRISTRKYVKKMAKNEKIAEISPFLPDKIPKKGFFQKISSRASRYHLEEDSWQFIAFIHNL